MLSSEDVVQLLDWLSEGVEVWLDGGWGVDALVGEQTRVHKDLDLIVLGEHASRMRELLSRHGFEHVWSSPAFVESSSWIPHATTVSCRASNSTGVSIPSAL